MNKEIYYETHEGQEFQAKPHISVMKSREFPKTWQVDLRWREDSSTVRVDAEFSFVDGLAPLTAALKDAFLYASILNVPIAKYKDNSMTILKSPVKPSGVYQNGQFEFLKNSTGARRFPTH